MRARAWRVGQVSALPYCVVVGPGPRWHTGSLSTSLHLQLATRPTLSLQLSLLPMLVSERLDPVHFKRSQVGLVTLVMWGWLPQ
jgi:hypothetical protein